MPDGAAARTMPFRIAIAVLGALCACGASAQSEEAPPAGWTPVAPSRWIERTDGYRLKEIAGPRLLPFAQRSAGPGTLWVGVGADRGSSGGARVELRWTMPLHGGPRQIK